MSDTPISDEFEIDGCDVWATLKYVRADRVRDLERAANAMEEALVEAISYVDRMGQDGVRERPQSALAQYRKLKP